MIVEGHFRTLPENADEIRFVVVSDSHRFETATKVSDMIAQFDPDFILHTGDMVEGTGSQKDQFPYWFQNVGSFLHNVPFIYNSGNHDYGCLLYTSQRYDADIALTTRASEVRTVLVQDLPDEVWNVVSGRISFEDGRQRMLIDSALWELNDMLDLSHIHICGRTRPPAQTA